MQYLIKVILLQYCLYFSHAIYGQKTNNGSLFIKDTIHYHEDSVTARIIRKKARLAQAAGALDRDNQIIAQNYARNLGLADLSRPFDGVFLRIWNWDDTSTFVAELKHDKFTNSCRIIEFNGTSIDSNYLLIIRNAQSNITPRCGWTNFWDTINSKKILALKTGKTLSDYPIGRTGLGYIQFEVVQHGQYRFYEYLAPSFFKRIDNDAKVVARFLNFFQRQINVAFSDSSRH